ncbi:DUF1801 domain-containing protein [Actinoplanes sp. TRM 88003]|uniref:DUF1801 domain-containing protein n=1 Tax=Paractinoplanes aksuensis TaxID=2939490 RepID=A0ABT1DIR5_9ACTN|nr:DUF1801 domain-containing protein [Actinoplanes aksuensis]MCO8270721.1 DUF1801 domain-containing protein [Actinoplanes aksuensis]
MDNDVAKLLDGIADEQRQRDARLLVELMGEVTGEPPALWSGGIIGFGTWHYKYESGREGDAAAIGFAPRKAQTVLYVTGYLDAYEDLLERLGPHTRGKGCLYVKRVDQADQATLRAIVARSHETATASPEE